MVGGYGGGLLGFGKAPKPVRVRLKMKWLAGLISTPEFVDRKEGAPSMSSSSTPIYMHVLVQ